MKSESLCLIGCGIGISVAAFLAGLAFGQATSRPSIVAERIEGDASLVQPITLAEWKSLSRGRRWEALIRQRNPHWTEGALSDFASQYYAVALRESETPSDPLADGIVPLELSPEELDELNRSTNFKILVESKFFRD